MVAESDTALWLPVLKDVTYREMHAFVDGFYCGIRGCPNEDYTQEKHYWRTGWVCGDAYDRYLRAEDETQI